MITLIFLLRFNILCKGYANFWTQLYNAKYKLYITDHFCRTKSANYVVPKCLYKQTNKYHNVSTI